MAERNPEIEKYAKSVIENRLTNLLKELLESGNQESGVISLQYDDVTNQCTVKMSVHIVKEDDYVGFSSY